MGILDKITLRTVVLGIVAIIMLIWTIVSASALSIDSDDYFVMHSGEEKVANFVVIDGQINGEVSVGEGFISFEDGRKYYSLENANAITNNAVVVDYTIKIPDNQPYDSYEQKIIVESGGELREMIVKIDVQNTAIAGSTNIFKDNRKIIFWGFVFIASIYIIWSMMNIKIPFKRGNNVYLLLLALLVFVSMIISTYFIIQETSLYYKHPNDELTHTFYIRDIVGTEKEGGGYISLERNEKTPSAVDMVSFEDGSKLQYFSISSGELVDKTAIVEISDLIESGIYYYDVRIVMNKENFIEEKSFRVKI